MALQAKCIQKFRNKNGFIVGYRLVDTQGNTKDVTPQQLKAVLKTGRLEVINLKLTSNNRLIDKNQAETNERLANKTSINKDDTITKIVSEFLETSKNYNTEDNLYICIRKRICIDEDKLYKYIRKHIDTLINLVLRNSGLKVGEWKRATKVPYYNTAFCSMYFTEKEQSRYIGLTFYVSAEYETYKTNIFRLSYCEVAAYPTNWGEPVRPGKPFKSFTQEFSNAQVKIETLDLPNIIKFLMEVRDDAVVRVRELESPSNVLTMANEFKMLNKQVSMQLAKKYKHCLLCRVKHDEGIFSIKTMKEFKSVKMEEVVRLSADVPWGTYSGIRKYLEYNGTLYVVIGDNREANMSELIC